MSNVRDATIAPTPAEELVALVAKVTAMSRQALDLTVKCLDVSHELPRVVAAQVAAAVADFTSDVAFVEEVAPTPDELDALFPPGTGDSQTWYVVSIGRQPGLYASPHDADDQVRGVPHQGRRKKDGRAEALAYYRTMYENNLVRKMVEISLADAAAEQAVASTSG
ncbi:hypothetical protein FB451DRAFT_1395542 [Mycena latifolia]|nr:hypothetical protein FB451DRAFT_1395542 [Mycena latifolia]